MPDLTPAELEAIRERCDGRCVKCLGTGVRERMSFSSGGYIAEACFWCGGTGGRVVLNDAACLLAEVDRLRELVMRPHQFHTCPDGRVQSYPSMLCSRHPERCEDFDPRVEIDRLRAELAKHTTKEPAP